MYPDERIITAWGNLLNLLYTVLDSYTTLLLFRAVPDVRDVSILVDVLHLVYGNSMGFLISMIAAGTVIYLIYSLIIYTMMRRGGEIRFLIVGYCFLLIPIIYRAVCIGSNVLHIVYISTLRRVNMLIVE